MSETKPAAEPASAGAWTDEECDALRRKTYGRLARVPFASYPQEPTVIAHERALIRAAAERAAREEREACVALLEAASLGIAASGTPAFPLAAGMLQQLKNAILARGKP